MFSAEYEAWMREALALARKAFDAGEVPVGAVIVHNGVLIAGDYERKIELSDPTAHAEILAMRAAAAVLGDWRLNGCTMFVTLEPCAMCAGATLLARLPLVVYGARNPKFGAVDTHVSVLEYPRWNHHVQTIGGLLEQPCAELLEEFFKKTRS